MQRLMMLEQAYAANARVVSVADHDLHEDEMAAMHRIGAAMDLTTEEVHRIIDECIGKY